MRIHRRTIAFVGQQLRALSVTRQGNAEVLRGFVDALSSVMGSPDAPKITRSARPLDPTPRGEAKPRGFVEQLRRHHEMASRALRAATPGSSLAFYGIDPARLDLDGPLDLSEALSVHTAAASPEMRTWFGPDGARWIDIAFDPKATPSYRSAAGKADRPVLSPLSMIMIWGLRFWRVSPVQCISVLVCFWRDVSAEHVSRRSRVVTVVTLWAFVLGATALIRPAKDVKMLCLTANSTFVEALRALITGIPGGYTVEVLHGINSPPFDPYFLSYRPALAPGNLGRFAMLPMLAHPFALPPETSPGFTIAKIPSNTGILRALNRTNSEYSEAPPQMLTSAHVPEIVAAIAAEMGGHCQPERPMVAIWGGTDLDPDYYDGIAFRSEFALVEKVRAGMGRIGLDPHFVYFLHPTNAALESLRFDDGSSVSLSRQTHLGYFCADYALGLYSTSIFESAAFGVHTFSPLTSDIGLMYPHMLSNLTTPAELTPQAVEVAISRFCDLPADGARDHRAKIESRVERYLAGEI